MYKPHELTRLFYFKNKTHQQVIDEINKRYPVKLKYNEDLINRVHNRYPNLTKGEIAIVVMGIFSCFRDIIISGDIINLQNFFINVKLDIIKIKVKNIFLPKIKIRVGTPKYIKNNM